MGTKIRKIYGTTKKQREKIIGFGLFFVILQIVQEIVVNIKGNDRIGRLQ